jgi:hypothetical protein
MRIAVQSAAITTVIVLSGSLAWTSTAHAAPEDCFELDGSMLAPGRTRTTISSGKESKYECTDQDRAFLKLLDGDRSFSEFIDTLKKTKQLKERSDVLVEQANAEYKASHNANVAYQAAQDREAASVSNALSSISQSLDSIAEAKRDQATSLANTADEIGRQSSQYEMERAAQQAQQEKSSRNARDSEHGPRIAPSTPQRVDPLSKSPEPSQTVESRRAAGLPDDPNAAKCIQDDDCARSLLQGTTAPKQ